MSPMANATKNYSASKNVVFKEALNAINALGFEIKNSDESNGIIEAKKGATFLHSTGQRVKVVVGPSGEGAQVYVESGMMQLVDYGKNRENVNNIFAELDKRILSPAQGYAPSPPPPPPPPATATQPCPTCGQPLTFIQQYGRWYCYNCKKYP